MVRGVYELGRKPEQCLGWTIGGEGPTRAYLNTANLGFSRRDDMPRDSRLPGAKVRPGYGLSRSSPGKDQAGRLPQPRQCSDPGRTGAA